MFRPPNVAHLDPLVSRHQIQRERPGRRHRRRHRRRPRRRCRPRQPLPIARIQRRRRPPPRHPLPARDLRRHRYLRPAPTRIQTCQLKSNKVTGRRQDSSDAGGPGHGFCKNVRRANHEAQDMVVATRHRVEMKPPQTRPLVYHLIVGLLSFCNYCQVF
jgi:hypothetical protein